ncbi:hypothetical protein OUZ56_010299 [Daphnia magna]|uniref:Uncharacterized protein n=1 Tax=Daphnia magna TaxID=35525 RepID=A0ABR0AID0_9CRUS|nr:hypothetical protein OUZ56_010299 [Daphnia magna]
MKTPLLPDNDLKQKRGRRKAAHTKLTNQLRKAVADHKMGAIRLKKLQVAAWRDELIRIYEDVKDLHHNPILLIHNVKPVKNGRFNLTPTTWKSSISPLGMPRRLVTQSVLLGRQLQTSRLAQRYRRRGILGRRQPIVPDKPAS